MIKKGFDLVRNEKIYFDNQAAAFSGGGSIATPIGLPNTDQSRDYALDGLGNWKKSGAA